VACECKTAADALALVSYRFGVGQKYQPAALLLGLGKILS
jgi:hypothetical protein